MTKSTRRWIIIIATIIIAILGISSTIYLAQQQQDTRSRAAASTSLNFIPSSPENNPTNITIGDNIALDIMIEPGSNRASLVRLELIFDATKLQPSDSPFIVNRDAFPVTQEGPIIQNGKILVSVSIGNDPSRAISTTTKVGTLNLRAADIGVSSIKYGQSTQVLSVASNDQATENVLSTANPAYILINNPPTATPTPSRTPTINPTPTPTRIIESTSTPAPTAPTIPTSTPVPTKTPTQQPTPGVTSLRLDVFLHGIGNSGDNANPLNFTQSNKNPLTKNRNIELQILNSSNTLIKESSGTVSYDSGTGSFKGTISLGTSLTSPGPYIIKIKETTHLRRIIDGIQNLNLGQSNSLPPVTLIAGDINNDNSLNILDYNLLMGCYSDLQPAPSCTEINKKNADLDDDGNINQFDYNLFLRELTVQAGQ